MREQKQLKQIEREDVWALFAAAAAGPEPATITSAPVAAVSVSLAASTSAAAIVTAPATSVAAPAAIVAPTTSTAAVATTAAAAAAAAPRHLNDYFDYVLVDAECTHDGSYR